MQYRNKKLKGNGILENVKNYYYSGKQKLNNINDYLKQKKFIHNLITNDVNFGNPVRAIGQSFGINKLLQNNQLLKKLDAMGYGIRRRRKKK